MKLKMFSLTFLIIIVLRKRAERAAKRKSRLDCVQIKMFNLVRKHLLCIENFYHPLLQVGHWK